MEITLASADQFLGIAFTLLAMQVSKKSFMTTSEAVKFIRIAFACSSLVQILIALYIKHRVSKINLQKKFKYRPEGSILSISENDQQEEVEISFAEYDSNEATKHLRSTILQVAFYTFLTFKFNAIQPLLIKTANLLKSLLFSPLYRAYLYNIDMERPFEKNPLLPRKTTPVPASPEKKKKKEE